MRNELRIMTMNNFDIHNPKREAEGDLDKALRPLSFDDFAGQDKVVENLSIFVQAARMRGESLDHTLLHGPPGLGKTTLSNIIANELGVGVKLTSGVVYWRNTSFEPGGGGVFVLGNGGLSY